MTATNAQIAPRAGFVDFAIGQPDPILLPGEALGAMAADLLRADATALGYGANAGPAELQEAICARLSAVEPSEPTEIVVCAGASQGLDDALAVLTAPGEAVVVESPTYNLALSIIRSRGLTALPIERTSSALDLNGLERAVWHTRRAGVAVRAAYLIPTFHNPTGGELALPAREAVIDLARELDLTIIEDDTYRELFYEGRQRRALYAAARDSVVRIGSFSKSLAPGLRIGWISARPELAGQLASSGVRISGGGPNHAAAMLVARSLQSGHFDRHVAWLREQLRHRRDALALALREAEPALRFEVPHGGYFLWVRLPAGLRGDDLAAAADSAGLSFLPGSSSSRSPAAARRVRLAFSLYKPEELAEGAKRFADLVARPGAQRRE